MTRTRFMSGIALLALLALAAAVAFEIARAPEPARFGFADGRSDPEQHARDRRTAEVAARFEQAVVMLHAKKYEHAIVALHRVLELAPTMPEAHVNMGYALLGVERHPAARDFFNTAIQLRPAQANAYYGLALAAEGDRDYASALGAMRTFLHLSRADDPHRAKARSALWEWESALGRHEQTSAAGSAAAGTTK